MSGLALLGLAALLGRGVGAPLCLSRQLRMQGDYVLGGLFPLRAAEDVDLGGRTLPNTPVCSRYGGGGWGGRGGPGQGRGSGCLQPRVAAGSQHLASCGRWP